jgi:hypothetical protein
MDRSLQQQRLSRERATYRYLQALDAGDMETISQILQQATYDVALEQMLLEAHQEYFQEEVVGKNALADIQTQTNLPIVIQPSHSKQVTRKPHTPRWLYISVATLIAAVLIGSLVIQLNRYQTGAQPTPTPAALCQPYGMRQFEIQSIPGSETINALNAVTAISTNDAWAVGYAASSPSDVNNYWQSPFITHWDGKNWKYVPSAQLPDKYSGELAAVAAASTQDVWAVGDQYLPSPDHNLTKPTKKTLIEHWNGYKWEIVQSPNGPAGQGTLYALTAVTPNDIWAAGSYDDAQGITHPLIMHWDGSIWKIVELEGAKKSLIGIITTIAATSDNDIWVQGLGREATATSEGPLLMHWDGKRWQTVAAPPSAKYMSSLSTLSPQQVWTANYTPLTITQWDGQQWKNMPLPTSISNWSDIRKIVAVSADNIWIIGTVTQRDKAGNPVASNLQVAHWDGTSWQPIALPDLHPPFLSSVRYDGLAILGEQQIWVVSSASNKQNEGGYQTGIILGQLTCP